MTDTATLTTQLAEARTALHAINTGTQAVSIEYEGRKVSYSPSSASKLVAYIAELEAKLGERTIRRRVLRPRF